MQTAYRSPKQPLIVVSNRLPLTLTPGADGRPAVSPGSGGLVSALRPVLGERGGVWVGWPGGVGVDEQTVDELLHNASAGAGYAYKAVPLTAADEAGFYQGFANQVIWPLFHGLPDRCRFESAYWHSYRQVNRTFALAVQAVAGAGAFIWAHDYHLMALAQSLEELGVSNRSGFFLHIPFPTLDNFLALPWRVDVLRALLAFDLLGFQTSRDRQNFVDCLRALCPDVIARDIDHATTALNVQRGTLPARRLRVGSFPISIDCRAVAARAASRRSELYLKQLRQEKNARRCILGVDRLDYTKGLPEKLAGFRRALRRFPELRRQLTLIQFVVPSRETIPAYRDLHLEIEHLVSEINGELSEPGWVPVHYFFRAMDPHELTAYYRMADIALVTPLKDGMNLVAKEYCAARIDADGVLILSEFAGAAETLAEGALIVNPFDSDGVADSIYRAFRMSAGERRERMRRLRRGIAAHDVFGWVDGFLRAAGGNDQGLPYCFGNNG